MGDKASKERRRPFRQRLDAVNKAVAINLGEGSSRTSVSSRRRIVQRDGNTTVVEERTERREG
ncbi:MAG: hypothetical protein ABR529_15600 [Actinomycetota bacterium]